MAKKFRLGRPELAEALTEQQAGAKRARDQQRLSAVRLAMSGELTLAQIAKAVGKARSTVAEWMRVVRVDGLSALLALHQGRGRAPQLQAKAQKELRTGLRRGRWRRLKDARAVARPAASGGDGLGRSPLLGKKSGGGLARAAQNPRPAESGTG